MAHHVAHPGEFLIVRFRDGRQEHLPGPADVWFDPRVHLDDHQARTPCSSPPRRRSSSTASNDGHGHPPRSCTAPTAVRAPAGRVAAHLLLARLRGRRRRAYRKVANGLVFQKLWLMPDQMYHDVTDVRTADDAVLTIRLMIFFELVDIERMLETTHDPIGDFVNAATSDVVDFTGRHDFECVQAEHRASSTSWRRTASSPAGPSQCGYRINKVVYRGYEAPPTRCSRCTTRPSRRARSCSSSGRPSSRRRTWRTSSWTPRSPAPASGGSSSRRGRARARAGPPAAGGGARRALGRGTSSTAQAGSASTPSERRVAGPRPEQRAARAPGGPARRWAST